MGEIVGWWEGRIRQLFGLPVIASALAVPLLSGGLSPLAESPPRGRGVCRWCPGLKGTLQYLGY
jgi:hypothetical protein